MSHTSSVSSQIVHAVGPVSVLPLHVYKLPLKQFWPAVLTQRPVDTLQDRSVPAEHEY